MTRWWKRGDDTVTRSPSLSAHLVDAPRGPLVGEGRLSRELPFAITAALSMLIAVPTTDWTHPVLAIVGSALGSTTIVAALVLPWSRVARAAQLTPPFLFLVAILLLASATGNGIGSPFVTMAVLPLMWLAIYEHRAAVLSAAAMTGAGLWLATRRGDVQASDLGIVSILVFVVCCAGMGVTLHSLVTDARRLTRSLRENQLAVEHAAAMLDALPERVNRYRLSDLAIDSVEPHLPTCQLRLERSSAKHQRKHRSTHSSDQTRRAPPSRHECKLRPRNNMCDPGRALDHHPRASAMATHCHSR